MTTSLEILEECFDRIYTTRKNVLASKHRSFTRTEDKRKRGKLSTPARSRGGGSPVGRGENRRNLADTLTRLQESDGDDGDDADGVGADHRHLSPPPPKRGGGNGNGNGGRSASTVAPKVIGSHQELNPNDLTATVVFDEFRTELMAWVTERMHALQSPVHAGKAPHAARKEYLEVRHSASLCLSLLRVARTRVPVVTSPPHFLLLLISSFLRRRVPTARTT